MGKFNLFSEKVVLLQKKDIPVIREQIAEEQNNLCAICDEPLERACLDHAHTKRLKLDGRIRGVICSTCNVYLAKIENHCVRCGIKHKDLPRILRNIALYLELKTYPFVHPSEAPKPKKIQRASYNKLAKKLNKMGIGNRLCEFPASGRLTKKLSKLYEVAGIEPEYYK